MSTSLKLYELTSQHKQLEALLDSEELPVEVIKDTIEALEGDIEAKSKSIAHVILNLESFSGQVVEAAEAMRQRGERIRRRAESIRQYLLLNLEASGIRQLECPEFTISVRYNPPAVEIGDLAVIPPEYMVTPEPPPPRPDKKALAAALKAGITVNGVWLRQGEHLVINV
jgi:Gp157 protein